LQEAALAAWSLFNFVDYGGVHIAARDASYSNGWLLQLQEAVAWTVALGGLTPLGLIAAIQSRQKLLQAEGAVYGVLSVGLPAMIAAVVSDDPQQVPRGKDRRAPDVFGVGGWVAMREYAESDAVDFAIVGTGAGGAVPVAKPAATETTATPAETLGTTAI
jgi:hypothetical protein